MKSKVLSKQDREEVLKAVKTKTLEKWNDSPLFDEMLELETEASKIVADKQLELVPESDREVLDRYGAETRRYKILFKMDENGTPREKWYHEKQEYASITVSNYNHDGTYTVDYPRNSSKFIALIHATRQDLLPRYHELWQLRECEVDNAERAFRRLLNGCSTTKQVYNNEALRPFMPGWMKTWQPMKREAPEISEDDAAIIAELTA